MNTSYHIARDVLGLVLLASGGGKLADVSRGAVLLLRLGMTSKKAAGRITLLLAGFEIALALAIFSAQQLLLVDIVVLALFVGFLAVMAYATRVAGGTRCRCFGALSSTAVGGAALLRNALFVAVAAVVVAAHVGANDVDPTSSMWAAPMVVMAGFFACACSVAARALDRTWEVRG